MGAIHKLFAMFFDSYANSKRTDLFLEGTDSVKGLEIYIEEDFYRVFPDPPEELSMEEALEIIIMGMNRYLEKFPASIPYKDMIYLNFKEIIEDIAATYDLEHQWAIGIFEDRIVRPVKTNIVDWIKELHPHLKEDTDEYYYSKRAFRRAFQSYFKKEGSERGVASVDRNQDKTITNILRALSGKGKTRYYIGGQPVKIKIEYLDIQDEDMSRTQKAAVQKIRHYYSPEIINPVVLQADLSQLYILLESLAFYCESHTESRAMETALDIWCQLSGYCREEIKNYFKDNLTVWNFICKLNDFCFGDKLFYYQK